MSPIAPWTNRYTGASGRIADVMFSAFHGDTLRSDIALAPAQFGAPSRESLLLLDLREIADIDWINGWRSGAIRGFADAALAGELAALDGATRCHLIHAKVADPFDRTHVQATWATARWLVARGAEVVLDVFAMRWWTAAMIKEIAVDEPFVLTREITIGVERPPTADVTMRVVHSRGMGKFARPDLVALVDQADVAAATAAIKAAAEQLADGWVPSDGASLTELPGLWREVTLSAAPDNSLATALHLHNDAWLIVNADDSAIH